MNLPECDAVLTKSKMIEYAVQLPPHELRVHHRDAAATTMTRPEVKMRQMKSQCVISVVDLVLGEINLKR